MTIGGASSWTIKADDASSVVIDDGVSTYLTFDTDTQLPQVEVGEFLELAAGDGGGEQLNQQSGQSCVIGSIVIARDNGASATRLYKSSAASGTASLRNVSGVVTTLDGDVCQVNTIHGSRVKVIFDTPPADTDNGSTVFLDDVATGRASLTAPSTTGRTVWALGILVGGDGAPTPEILWNPQFRYHIA